MKNSFLIILFFLVSNLLSQTLPKMGMHLSCNIPDAPFGMGGIFKSDSSYLFGFDCNMTLGEIPKQYEFSELLAESWNDKKTKEYSTYFSFDAFYGPFMSNIYRPFFGLGFASTAYYQGYMDEMEILSDDGEYSIRIDDKAKSSIYGLIGILFMIDKFYLGVAGQAPIFNVSLKLGLML